MYAEQINQVRDAARVTRHNLQRIVDNQPGPQATAVLVARMALEQATIIESIETLSRIGQEAKQERTK